MDILDEMLMAIVKVQPGGIEFSSWDRTTLLLKTPTIRFSTMSSWRIVCDNRLIVGCEDDGAGNYIENMIGKRIVEIRALQIMPKVDPEFVFDDGLILQVFSATTYWESWVMAIQGADKVYVSILS